MAKLNAELKKRAEAMGLKVNDEDQLREKLLTILKDNEIEGMEEEETMTLIEIAESFYDGAADNGGKESSAKAPAAETEEELDQLADEEGKEVSAEEEETKDKEDEFDAMSREQLKQFISDNELGIKVKKSMTDDDLREAVRAAVAESAEEEQKEEAPAEKPAKKAEKPAEKKQAKKETAKKPSARGIKLNPRENEEDRKYFDCLKELFSDDEFDFDWVSTSGVTIKHKGKNGRRGAVLLENCTLQNDGKTIKMNMYLLTMTKQKEVLEENDIDFETCWTGAPFMKGITMENVVEILGIVRETILSSVTKIDKKLGDNRAKMEENLKKSTKKAAKK
jgi:hypothetical protein